MKYLFSFSVLVASVWNDIAFLKWEHSVKGYKLDDIYQTIENTRSNYIVFAL